MFNCSLNCCTAMIANIFSNLFGALGDIDNLGAQCRQEPWWSNMVSLFCNISGFIECPGSLRCWHVQFPKNAQPGPFAPGQSSHSRYT